MICVILVAGHGTVLENQIKTDDSGKYTHLRGVPKALLPGVGGTRILDFWWEAINKRQFFNEVYVVTNADKYKHFERWATSNQFPVENIVNDGTTTHKSRLGSVADFDLALRSKHITDDVTIVAGDMLFQDHKFDMEQVLNFFKKQAPSGNVMVYYEMGDAESTASRGIVEVCPQTKRVQNFFEKPKAGETDSRLASVVFYCMRKSTLDSVEEYLTNNPGVYDRTFGQYMAWLVNAKKVDMFGLKLPSGFQLIGQIGLSEYDRWLNFVSDKKFSDHNHKPLTKKAYARIGLVGNPSDGYYGKTIAFTISNFWAEVTIVESESLRLVPHPLNDPTVFGSLSDLHGTSLKEGYFGGLRLLQATCKLFYQYCSDHGIALAKRNFTLKYDTNIPKQVGLAGSSAIVTATLRCLMHFFNLSQADMPLERQPQFVLDVESRELFITAGLQDRVVQVYEGLVYMDFRKDLMDSQQHGDYEKMNVELPTFWLAYIGDPSDSGMIHSDVRARWLRSDETVITTMESLANLTDVAKLALKTGDFIRLQKAMDENFDLRRSIFGDEALGPRNLRMVEIARSFGSSCKFPGSGGAVVGMCLDMEKMKAMKQAFQSEGYVFCDIQPRLQE